MLQAPGLAGAAVADVAENASAVSASVETSEILAISFFLISSASCAWNSYRGG
jgi:hypothetical protein